MLSWHKFLFKNSMWMLDYNFLWICIFETLYFWGNDLKNCDYKANNFLWVFLHILTVVFFGYWHWQAYTSRGQISFYYWLTLNWRNPLCPRSSRTGTKIHFNKIEIFSKWWSFWSSFNFVTVNFSATARRAHSNFNQIGSVIWWPHFFLEAHWIIWYPMSFKKKWGHQISLPIRLKFENLKNPDMLLIGLEVQSSRKPIENENYRKPEARNSTISENQMLRNPKIKKPRQKRPDVWKPRRPDVLEDQMS